METPCSDFAVAANFAGDEAVDDGEETVICAKLATEHKSSKPTDFRDRKLHTPGDRYVLVALFVEPYRKSSSGYIGRIL